MLGPVIQALESADVVIVTANPLSNVPVSLPLFLRDSGYSTNGRSILVTNPSHGRVKELAARASQSLTSGSSNLGKTVGFSLPFLSVTSSATEIEYVSDALVGYELAADPFLSKRSVVVVDDAHIRSKWTDVFLSLAKCVLQYEQNENRESKIKLVLNVSPTCLQLVDQLIDFFSKPTSQIQIQVVELEVSKALAVDTYYLDTPTSDYLEQTVKSIISVFDESYFAYPKKHKSGGDVVVFLPTKSDVLAVTKAISNQLYHLDSYKKIKSSSQILFYSLHENTDSEELLSLRKFDPAEDDVVWRVIVATSIAENDYQLLKTRRICAVIDSGFDSIKLPAFNRQRILLRQVSKSKAEIRREMAGCNTLGHTGKCFRLYSHETAKHMSLNDDPELSILLHIEQESSFITPILADVFLLVISLQIKSLSTRLEFLPPIHFSSKNPNGFISEFNKNYMYLFFMECVDSNCRLTPVGTIVSQLPFIPIPFARAIVASMGNTVTQNNSEKNGNCLNEMVTIVAMFLAGGSSTIFITPSSKHEREDAVRKHSYFQVAEGDAISLLNVYELYQQQGGAGATKIGKWAAENFLNYRALLRAEGIRTQILRHIQNISLPPHKNQAIKDDITERLCKCICQGFFLNAAKTTFAGELDQQLEHEGLHKGDTGVRYELISEKPEKDEMAVVRAHSSSIANQRSFHKDAVWVVYTSLVEHGNNEWVIEGVTTVKREWLVSCNFYQEQS